VAGGGFEYGLARNWSIRGEYLYYSTDAVTAIGVPVPVGVFPLTVRFDWDRTNLHVARLAINYGFDWGKGPVAGKGPVVTRY
jgi:hypothetical protein